MFKLGNRPNSRMLGDCLGCLLNPAKLDGLIFLPGPPAESVVLITKTESFFHSLYDKLCIVLSKYQAKI